MLFLCTGMGIGLCIRDDLDYYYALNLIYFKLPERSDEDSCPDVSRFLIEEEPSTVLQDVEGTLDGLLQSIASGCPSMSDEERLSMLKTAKSLTYQDAGELERLRAAVRIGFPDRDWGAIDDFFGEKKRFVVVVGNGALEI